MGTNDVHTVHKVTMYKYKYSDCRKIKSTTMTAFVNYYKNILIYLVSFFSSLCKCLNISSFCISFYVLL